MMVSGLRWWFWVVVMMLLGLASAWEHSPPEEFREVVSAGGGGDLVLVACECFPVFLFPLPLFPFLSHYLLSRCVGFWGGIRLGVMYAGGSYVPSIGSWIC